MRDARPGHGRLRPLRRVARLALLHAVAGCILAHGVFAGCDGAGRVVELDATGFVDVGGSDAAASADAGSGAGGCTLRQPVPCEGVGCCDPAVPRCVPALGGANRCVQAGDLRAGDLCAVDGTDACGLNLLCLVRDGAGACVPTCASDADCAEGTCTSVSTAAGQASLCIAG